MNQKLEKKLVFYMKDGDKKIHQRKEMEKKRTNQTNKWEREKRVCDDKDGKTGKSDKKV